MCKCGRIRKEKKQVSTRLVCIKEKENRKYHLKEAKLLHSYTHARKYIAIGVETYYRDQQSKLEPRQCSVNFLENFYEGEKAERVKELS